MLLDMDIVRGLTTERPCASALTCGMNTGSMNPEDNLTPDAAGSRLPPGVSAFLAAHDIPEAFALRMLSWLALFIVLGIAMIGIGAYKARRAKQIERSSQEIFRARTIEDLNKAREAAPVSALSATALLKLAQAYFIEGNYTLAYASYERFIAAHPHHELIDAAHLGKIVCVEAQGLADRALESYSEFAAGKTNSFLRTEALFGTGRCLEQLERLEEARQIYEELIVDLPDSRWSNRAREALRDVEIEMDRRAGTL